ncbi:LysE type translocator [Mariprofundus micogutta]|uniref:LysE type translocator n=1 Tax=Mariprofundus micogutta TaxID=1921010 RepID=A0A1L8CKC0_9PROT|nr:LysE family transporter [Mariprofundus micogutta]GAV19356.1 LysE type translocator [Mariprofundus micogutta]
MIDFLIIGCTLGLTAGFAPGPLLTLVISETLQHDVKSGIRVALAPVISDLPIIILTLFISAQLSDFKNLLGLISISGGIFVLLMSYESVRAKDVPQTIQKTPPKSLLKGILVNALSPYPYLFWFTVGASIMSKAMEQNIDSAVAFIASFYTLLVGSKVVLAMLVGKSKSFLNGTIYIYIMRLLALILTALAFALFFDGLMLLGIINLQHFN